MPIVIHGSTSIAGCVERIVVVFVGVCQCVYDGTWITGIALSVHSWVWHVEKAREGEYYRCCKCYIVTQVKGAGWLSDHIQSSVTPVSSYSSFCRRLPLYCCISAKRVSMDEQDDGSMAQPTRNRSRHSMFATTSDQKIIRHTSRLSTRSLPPAHSWNPVSLIPSSEDLFHSGSNILQIPNVNRTRISSLASCTSITARSTPGTRI